MRGEGLMSLPLLIFIAGSGKGDCMLEFTYFMPTRIIFGPGKLAVLQTLRLPGVTPLVVSSMGGSQRRNGTLDRVLALLRRNGCAPVLFERVRPNPVLETVYEGVELARREQCDFVLGLGGGSSIDAAKAIAAGAVNDGVFWDYVKGGSGGARRLKHPALPVVAVPTTAGTGTEADPWCVITRTETREKIGWSDDSTFPVCAVVDPELMLTVPPRVTAITGMGAFFHSAEAFLATCRQPASDLLAVEAIRAIVQFLPRAVQDGSDLEARIRLAWAGTAAGLCESYSSCVALHAMEHALSAFSPELPHGLGLVLLSGPFFERMACEQPERCVRLAAALGVDVTEVLPARRPALFVQRLREFIRTVGLADVQLAEYGLMPEMIPALTDNALRTMGGLLAVTPAALDAVGVEALFRQAFAAKP